MTLRLLVEGHTGHGVAGTVARAKVTKVCCVWCVGVASQTTQQTCCQLVADLLVTSPSMGKLRGNWCNGFWA